MQSGAANWKGSLKMNVQLTPELEQMIQSKVQTDRSDSVAFW